MAISDFTIRLIILILPGIIGALIVETLTIHEKWSPFQFSTYAILLGFISYILYQLFLYGLCLSNVVIGGGLWAPKIINFWASLFDKAVPVSMPEVIITCLFSVALGFIVTGFIEHKVLSSIAKKINVSNKYGEENLYTHFLNSDEVEWVWVRDSATGLTYEGFVETFSENETIQEIRLGDVKVYYSENSTLLYELSNAYFAGPPGRFSIEIPKAKEDTGDAKANS